MRYLCLLVMLLGLGACSIEDQLECSDELNVISMESDLLPVSIIGDKATFKVMASSNSGLRKMEITAKSEKLELLKNEVAFSMIGEEKLALDGQGNFNRPVSTVCIAYPVLLPDELAGETVFVEFTFTAADGARKSVRIYRQVTNFRPNYMETLLYDMFPQSGGNMFYSSTSHISYTYQQCKANKAEIDVYEYYDSRAGKHYLISPASSRAKAIIDAVDKIQEVLGGQYDPAEMNKTLFVKLAEKDLKKIGDKELAAIDFSLATEEITFVQGDCIGFLTQEGKKGVLNISSINASHYPKVKSIVQAKI